MMNKDKNNDKIRKIVKKGLTLSLCAVLAGGVAAGSFEGFSALTGETTVQAADKNDAKLTYAKSEKKADKDDAKEDDSKSDSKKSDTAKGSLDVSDIAAEALPLYLLQQNLFRRFRPIMECTECTDMPHSRNRR